MGMLTQARVERLMADLSGRVRAETATIVADEFASGHLNETDQRVARDIIAVLARDVEIQVREAIAEHLKSCPLLPREVALELAYDIETVAVPILQFSTSLTDDDLIAIVGVGSTAKQVAIARRAEVTEPVTEVLVETGDPVVVGAVLGNEGARISDASLSTVASSHRQDEEIQRLLIDRPRLPISATQELVQHVSDELCARLVLKHGIPPQLAHRILGQGREGAIARLIAESDVPAGAVAGLRGALTPTLLLRCLCLGNLGFVETALATLAAIPTESARTLIRDPGPLGLPSLYRKACLPPALLPAFRTALSANLERTADPAASLPRPGRPAAGLTSDILDRLLREYRDISPGNLEHVLAELDRIGRSNAHAAPASVMH